MSGVLSFKHFALSGVSLGAAFLAAPALAQPVQLGPVSVQDQADRNALNHAPPVAAMPYSSLQDTPQAVTVVSSETMKAQATSSLGEALRNVPGITIAIGEGGTLAGDQFKIRGFDAKDDVYLDGLRDFAAYTRDSFNYEEVQVLKGPSGLMFGRGTTGGAINVVSKTPHLGTVTTAHLEGGNGAHARATIDSNYQLSDSSAVRLNAMFTDTGVVDREFVHSARWGVAGSVALGLGAETTFVGSYIHQHATGRPDYGIPVAVSPVSAYALPATENGVPRQNFVQFWTDRDRNDADLVTARITHAANSWLTIQNDARASVYSRWFQYTTVDRCETTAATNNCAGTLFSANPVNSLAGIGGGGPYNQNSWGAQDVFTATADFRVGAFRNLLVAGFDAGYQAADRTIYAYSLPATSQYAYQLGDHTRSRANIGISLFNPTHLPPPGYAVILPTAANATGANAGATSATATTVVTSTGTATDLALFATDRFWLDDAWSLVAGVRVDRYTAKFDAVTVAGTSTSARSPSTLVNPRASLVWEPDQKSTFYFSWSKASIPVGTSVVGAPTPITTANQALDPEESETLEFGAKYNLFDGGLGLSGSVFKVLKSNALLTDPVSGNVQLQSGQKQRVQGIELSATGGITEELAVTSAYTWLDPVITHDLSCGAAAPIVCNPNPYTIGRQIYFVPRNAASIWLDYSARSWIEGLTLGGGLVYQSRLFNAITTTGAAPNPTGIARIATIPETIELDAVASYDFGDAWRLQLNVNNLTDRLNYSQSFGNRGTPSPGRTFIVSLEAAL